MAPKRGRKKNLSKNRLRGDVVPRGIPLGPPQHLSMRLRYAEDLTLVSTATVLDSRLWRINDLFDPNQSGSGHQPMYRDQMYDIYSYGRVLQATIKVTFSLNETTPGEVFVSPARNGSAFTDFISASEQNGSRTRLLSAARNVAVITISSSADKYSGSAPGTTLINNGCAQSSGSGLATPESMWYCIGFKTHASSATCYARVELTQLVRFEDPRQQVSS